MKPQTVDEYLDTRPSLNTVERAVVRMTWIDAHENAALVYIHRSGTWSKMLAEAIREQGRK